MKRRLSLQDMIPLGRFGKLMAGLTLVMLLCAAWLSFSGRPLLPWTLSSLPDLAATGELPSLHTAMETDPVLRQRVQMLGEKNEQWLFSHYADVDKEVAAILLLWAGADMTTAARTAEGLDSRVETFLRKIYGLGPDDYIVGSPLVGDKPWVRWFTHFKSRLMIQMAAMRVYDGDVVYDVAKDRIILNARLSPAFLDDFTAFARQQPDPTPYINNLIAFIDQTAGLAHLSDKDKKRVKALTELRK